MPAPSLPPVFEGGTWTTGALMALRVEIERVDGKLARTMPFMALRCGTGGLIAATGDSIDLARFLVSWTQLDRDAALISTFETRAAASSWLSITPPPLPMWAARTFLAMDDEDVINLEDDTNPFAVFALLRQVGGQLAAEGNTALIPRHVNTVKALNGEVAVVRMLSSMSDAEEWLLKPRVPAWLLAPAAVLPTADETKGEDAVVVTVTTSDGVIHLSDDEEDGQDAEATSRSAFRRAALALPPPPPLKRSIMSLSSIKDSMLLPVAFQRHSVTGRVLRARRGGPDTADGDSSSATDASLLTPPFPPKSTPSMASRSPGAGTGSALSARPLAQTCTPVPARACSSDSRPPKKLRTGETVAFDMGRLAKAILRRKKRLFVTGGGGVGKTRLLRQCADEHRQAHGGGRVGLHVVAPTGVAAAAAGGVTIHSYLRLPAGCFDESLSEEQDAAGLYNNMGRLTKRRLADTTLILLDEVSMVPSIMFTLLIYSLEMAHAKMDSDVVRRIVVFGDFFQLPPVRGEEDNYDTSGLYAFKSVYWNRLFQNDQLLLRYVWRQENKRLIKMLSHLRVGDVTTDLADFLQSRANAYEARVRNGGVKDMKITRIFPHRRSVQAHNLACLSTMERENGCARVSYLAIEYPIGVNMSEEQVTTQLNASIMAPKKLEVCVGARVAACASIGDGQAEVPNGTIGTVIGFTGTAARGSSSSSASVPVVRFDATKGPLVLAVNHVDMKLQSV